MPTNLCKSKASKNSTKDNNLKKADKHYGYDCQKDRNVDLSDLPFDIDRTCEQLPRPCYNRCRRAEAEV